MPCGSGPHQGDEVGLALVQQRARHEAQRVAVEEFCPAVVRRSVGTLSAGAECPALGARLTGWQLSGPGAGVASCRVTK